MGYQLWISPTTGYRRRGTTFAELKALLEAGLTTDSISEPLRCCNPDDDASEVCTELNRLEFDVVGVKDSATQQVIGWIEKGSLTKGKCGQHLLHFETHQLVSGSSPLVEIIRVLADHERVYVVVRRGVSGIVTRGDLRKPPVRMLVFGLISLLEMHLTFWVGELFPDKNWQSSLSPARLEKMSKLLKNRKERLENISDIDCLQLCDKRAILTKSEEARTVLGLDKKNAVVILKSIEHLRDCVAHSQPDFIGNSGWAGLAKTVDQIERILEASEAALNARVAASTTVPPRLNATN